MYLIPSPKSINTQDAQFRCSDHCIIAIAPSAHGQALLPAQQVAQDLQAHAAVATQVVHSINDAATADVRLSIDTTLSDAYHMSINEHGVSVQANSDSNLFHACQTLRQIIRQCGQLLPHLNINDSADFPVRGFYHDITRGRVPTFDMLCDIADQCAFYKLNQLQLYIEHSFNFQKHQDIAAGKSPITAEEILKLDEYCKQRHIELVPSLTTFGHCYEILRCKRKEHLGELGIKGSEYPYSWWDRQAHYTLDSLSDEAFSLVEDMLDEYIPLFSSPYFNICCDETVDLELGKNSKQESPSKLYMDFTKKVIDAVTARGRKVQMWGDILQEHPECIKDLPKDVTVLNWSYDPALTRGECEPFEQAGLDYYVCPGTTGWNHFFNKVDTASQNIVNFSKEGFKHGAKGLLNTDWGDYGHPGLFSCSIHGLALGAQVSWNVAADGENGFDEALSLVAFNDRQLKIGPLLRSFSSHSLTTVKSLALLFDPLNDIPSTWAGHKHRRHFEEGGEEAAGDFSAAATAMRKDRDAFLQYANQAGSLSSSTLQHISIGMLGEILIHEVAHLVKCAKGSASDKQGLDFFTQADALRQFEHRYADAWHAQSKPAEYSRVRDFLINLANLLDEYGVAES